MDPESVLQAVLHLWDEWPALLGSAWVEVYPRLQELVTRLQVTQDSSERVSLTAELVLVFREYSQVRSRLLAAIQEASRARGVTSQRGSSQVRGGTEPVPPPPNWSELLTQLQQQLDQALTRYVNVCMTEPRDKTPVPMTMNLGANQAYDLRVDIGSLSSDSVVEHPETFPAELLPETETGHWLEVVAVSDDFVIPRRRHNLFLPTFGKSWVCDCSPGDSHTCRKNIRKDYLFIPMTAPQKTGRARLRLGVYYAKSLIQAQLLTAQIADAERDGMGYSSRIDYTLTARLSDVSFLPPRDVHFLTNRNADGTHRIVLNGDRDDVLAFNLAEGQIRDTLAAVRQALRQIHYEEYGGQLGGQRQRRTLLEKNNAKTKAAFLADLQQLAPLGWKLWTVLLKDQPPEAWPKLREPATIQVSRTSGSTFVFPWALVYDIPLETFSRPTVCRLVRDWDGKSAFADQSAQRCPYEGEHGAKNTLCPFGFWGLKHIIEQPPSMPRGRDLPLVIRAANQPRALVVGRSLELDAAITKTHLEVLAQELQQFKLLDCDSLAEIVQALKDPVEIVYFYCHGRRQPLQGAEQLSPYLEVGKGEAFQPDDIITWRVADWPPQHWQDTSPLVFINGCHTAEITPESLVNFVDSFTAAYAAGVVGTEVTLEQPIASEAAEQFLRSFQANQMTVGQALQQMRLHFLLKGNLLGLAYTPYCSADLKLAGV